MLPDGTDERVLLRKSNAIHPQNMARAFAKGLANEGGSSIYRIALGNGGTYTDSANNIIIKPSNDGQGHDSAAGWASRLYNETYSEVVDDTSPSVGRDLGSVNGLKVRVGGGDRSDDDPDGATSVVSRELGLVSQTIITAYLNPSEPGGQLSTHDPDPMQPVDTPFYFDEIGLYTRGKQNVATFAYQNLFVNNQTAVDPTGLSRGSQYTFEVALGTGLDQVIRRFTIQVPVGGSDEVTYGELCHGLNTGSWITAHTAIGPNSSQVTENSFVTTNNYGLRAVITDTTGEYASIVGAETNGFLQFQSTRYGDAATIRVTFDPGNTSTSSLLDALTGGDDSALLEPIQGSDPGVPTDATNSLNEVERLLAHLCFSPILKSSDRIIVIKYILTIALPRSPSQAQRYTIGAGTTTPPTTGTPGDIFTLSLNPGAVEAVQQICDPPQTPSYQWTSNGPSWLFAAHASGHTGGVSYIWRINGTQLAVVGEATNLTIGDATLTYYISSSTPAVLNIINWVGNDGDTYTVSVTGTDEESETATASALLNVTQTTGPCE